MTNKSDKQILDLFIKVNMNDLLDDLLLIIFEQLKYSDLVNFLMVNKRFLSLIKKRYQSSDFKYQIYRCEEDFDKILLIRFKLKTITFNTRIGLEYSDSNSSLINFQQFIDQFDSRDKYIYYEDFDFTKQSLFIIEDGYFKHYYEGGKFDYYKDYHKTKFPIKGIELNLLRLLKEIKRNFILLN